jgi:hypothetical protein
MKARKHASQQSVNSTVKGICNIMRRFLSLDSDRAAVRIRAKHTHTSSNQGIKVEHMEMNAKSSV